jgi:transcriptional regulator with GAF, ATPase, and Fis domain
MNVFDRSDDQTQPGAGGGAPAAGAGPDASRWPPIGDLRSLLEMVATTELTLVDVLRHVADEAADRVPAADGVLVAARRHDDSREVVATTDVAAAVDELQLGLREGPVLDATDSRSVLVSPDLTWDDRWPRLAGSIGTDGVHSALCVALCADDVLVGTLSFYTREPDAFDERSREVAVRLATSAGPTIGDVLILDRVRRLTLRLHLEGADRSAVDEAITVLMEENGVGTDEALAVLQMLGRTEQEDLVTVARAIVAARA